MYTQPCGHLGPPRSEARERAVVVAKLNSGCEVALYVVSNNEGKSLLQGDSVVKVTRSFPEFPSRNYTTTGMVVLHVEIAEFCWEFVAVFPHWYPPSILLVSPAFFACSARDFFVMAMSRNFVLFQCHLVDCSFRTGWCCLKLVSGLCCDKFCLCDGFNGALARCCVSAKCICCLKRRTNVLIKLCLHEYLYKYRSHFVPFDP